MTYLDAAYSILHAAGRPLRFEEITEAALGRKLISPQGLTPEATMASRLYIDSLQEDSRFVRASSPDGMISPAQIPGTALWIETNQSAKSVVQVIGKLLAALGHAPDQFTVNRAMPPLIESRPVSTQNAEPYLHRDR